MDKPAVGLNLYIKRGIEELRSLSVITASEVRIGKMTEWYDCSKAINELGLPQTPVDMAIRKALNWFEENGYLRRPKGITLEN
jgi:dihydroflavonol-4-reductase